MRLSVLVAILDEERRLKDCLLSLKRFDDVTVVDLGSKDHSVEIAQSMGFKVTVHPWVPIGEMILPATMPKMQNDWIIRVDPDEVLPSNLVDDLMQLTVNDNIAIVNVPYQYYFRNQKLDTTIWGGVRPIPRVINRTRVNVTPEVHRTLNCKPGYESFTLPSRPGNAVLHYWADSYPQLISKHERYLKMEGESRYNHGIRFDWVSFLLIPFRSFQQSFIKSSGWRGGWNGWFLSVFFAYYQTKALLSLYFYEKQLNRASS